MPVENPAVVATGVTYRYGARTAIAASSFEIPERAITTIIGPNGSGKSTALNGIAGVGTPTAGSIRVLPIDGRTRRISYVLQTTKVNESLPITVREVVTMGRYPSTGPYGWLKESDRRAVRVAMDRMEIADLAERHLTELSGGQRQRVFVAQGLAQDHDMLLLDETLTGLDITSAHAIDDVIHEELRHGCTIVLTTHDLTAAQVADHVVLMSGRVVASGPPDEVLTEANLRDAYGPSFLHVEGTRIFLDDPAHRPTSAPHEHQDRSIHVEASPTEFHGGDTAAS